MFLFTACSKKLMPPEISSSNDKIDSSDLTPPKDETLGDTGSTSSDTGDSDFFAEEPILESFNKGGSSGIGGGASDSSGGSDFKAETLLVLIQVPGGQAVRLWMNSALRGKLILVMVPWFFQRHRQKQKSLCGKGGGKNSLSGRGKTKSLCGKGGGNTSFPPPFGGGKWFTGGKWVSPRSPMTR
ncbi:MAG: hypothetical protein Ct9H300mP23_05390 [Nitrospinota bacterium]|nr:MAG: hypothetical protein Ct9H300mP23_05390 [Nitrospinota bacterium]